MPVVTDGVATVREEEAEKSSVARRVLIIDDNVDAAESLAALVTALGGQAVTATGGEAGLERAAVFQPDVVLLDIQMPGIDGYETCRRLRGLPGGEAYHVVALTGYGQEKDRVRALRRPPDQARDRCHARRPPRHAGLRLGGAHERSTVIARACSFASRCD
jgi:CheY-like chemotaxis protein